MNKINWKAKLTSRKFWAALASFVAMLVVAFGGSQETATQVTALIMAGATVIAYIVGEGLVDAAAAGTPTLPADELIAAEGKTDDPATNAPQTGAQDKSVASAQ